MQHIDLNIDRTSSRSRASLRVREILLFFLGVVFVAAANAQEPNRAGTISGQVIDQANGVLQDAAVILLNSSASVRLQQTKTAQDGTFAFQNVPSGDYLVEVQRTGFTQAERKITLAAAQPLAPLTIQDDGSRSRPTGNCHCRAELVPDGRVFDSDQDEYTAE